jgi:cyclin H
MTEVSPPTKRPLYEASTQFKHWRFSREKLAEIRSALNSEAVQAIKSTLEAQQVREDLCSFYAAE